MISFLFVILILAATYTTAVPYGTSQVTPEEYRILKSIYDMPSSRTGPYSFRIENEDYSDLSVPRSAVDNRETTQLGYGEVIPGPVRIEGTLDKYISSELAYTTKVPYIYEEVRSTLQAAVEKQKLLDDISLQSPSNTEGVSSNSEDEEYSDMIPPLIYHNDKEVQQPHGHNEVIPPSPGRSEGKINYQGAVEQVPSKEPLSTKTAETQSPAIVTTIETIPLSTIATATISPTIVPSLAPALTNISITETKSPLIVLPTVIASSVTSRPGLKYFSKEPTAESGEDCSTVVNPCVPYAGGVCEAIACIPAETRTYDIFCLEANCFCCLTSLRVSEALPSPAFTYSTVPFSIVNGNITPPGSIALNTTGSVPVTNSGIGAIYGSITTTSTVTIAPENSTHTDQGLSATYDPVKLNTSTPGSLKPTGSGVVTTLRPGPVVTTISPPVTPCPNGLQGIMKILICLNLTFEEDTKCSACSINS